MNRQIRLSEPVITGNELKYIKECLDSGWVSSAGKFVDDFADKFSEHIGSLYAIPVVNGTAALHVSLIALGLKPDEEVLIPAITFVATANAISYCNAHPVFMDVEADTLTIDTQKVERFLTRECFWKNNSIINKNTGHKVSGFIPVHIYGHPVDMDPIMEMARRYNLFVVEDATEALGSGYKGKKVGTFGDTAAFSFNGNKLITTGGGGMVATNDALLADRVGHLSTQARSPGMEYYHTQVGYNYRLTNIQAAMGLAQIERVNQFIREKRRIAKFYQRELGYIWGLKVCQEKEWAFSNYWLSWIIFHEEIARERSEILNTLNMQGIQARPLFVPLHLLPPYRGCQTYCMELSEKLYQTGINIPSHVTLNDEDLSIVSSAIKKITNEASIASKKIT
jgi:perosamine synthetase